ncbi:MAG: hypothetical protein DRJ03_22910 [Chloroflexi bacterium]|nr:MAG: hypothetical protein DRJ03_22910 [Chloroflexota bacterium]
MRSAAGIEETRNESRNFYDALLEAFFKLNKDLFKGKRSEVVTRLSEKYNITKAWAYEVLKRLEEMGLIRIEPEKIVFRRR